MRLAPEARHRVLSLARHAAVAAGLGVGWLLLGGSSASASSDPTPPLPVSSQVLSSPVVNAPAQLTATAVKPVAAALPPVAPVQELVAPAQDAVPQVQNEVASAVKSTTTALSSAVAATPSVVAPVLQGPLEPLEPVVTHTASRLGQTVAKVGNAVSAAPSPVAVNLPSPVTASTPAAAPAPASPVLAAPSPNVANPSVEASPDGAPTAGQPATQAPAVERFASLATGSSGVGALSWAAFWASVLPNSLGTVAQTPLDLPPLTQPVAPPAGPSDSAGGGSSGPTPPVQGNAALAAEFSLAPLFFLLGRARPRRELVPASPAFDPGSTPD
ncbi:hypothetical protein [Sinomonas humi]|uniref:Uncharacterized protein n=1 Tax=Sinomonas humi TaxID=1338436 RepID=A0A0B2ACV7_9MICC|nr:hypothetical protein [Sinomonas humi]KHL01076.1 hypothetical protein LK10_18225 [Sinomonas humi]